MIKIGFHIIILTCFAIFPLFSVVFIILPMTTYVRLSFIYLIVINQFRLVPSFLSLLSMSESARQGNSVTLNGYRTNRV